MNQRLSYLLFGFVLFITGQAYSQLIVSNAMTPQQLVQNVFVGGGVTVSNITYVGHPTAIGSFSTGANATNLNISSGIIMASGNVSTAIGPNNQGGAGTNLNTAGDALLNTLVSPNPTYDAAVLEFDFIPLSDTIKFRFVFGSEEYIEFVNSSFNDVFGFFISGLNPAGGFYTNYNIARVPGTTIPISINNVNHITNSQYYVNNGTGTTPMTNPWIQYDGFTVVLTAWARVFPCLPYHFKLAIADAGDGILDSGVFLEAYSFSSNTVGVTQSFSKPSIDTIAVEGCSDAILTFRLPAVKAVPTTIYYGIGGTATNGVDYLTIPSSVTIPAGMDSVNLVIQAILDSIPEPTEYIMLTVATSPCTYDTVYVYIRNYEPMELEVGCDTVICDGLVSIPPLLNGGIAPFSYQWSTGDTLLNLNTTLSQTTQLRLSVADQCQVTSDSLTVFVSKPFISISTDTICEGEEAVIWANAPGGVVYEWDNGSVGDTLDFSPPVTINVQVVVTDTMGCKDSLMTQVVVNFLPALVVSNDTVICIGDTAELTASGGFVYVWGHGDTGSLVKVSPVTATVYFVTATSAEGCVSEGQTQVEVIPIPAPGIYSEKDSICRGATLELVASGADEYVWSTGSSAPSIVVSPKVSTVDQLTGINRLHNSSCQVTVEKDVFVSRCFNLFFPNAFQPGTAQNGLFGPIGEFSYVETFEIIVFDRWGNRVFESKSPFEHWDGSKNNSGEVLPIGVYTYMARVKEYLEEPILLYGTVHLMR